MVKVLFHINKTMNGYVKLTSTCDWCLANTYLQRIEPKLSYFWQRISKEIQDVTPRTNICRGCKSRLEEFSVFIDEGKKNESLIEQLYFSREIKEEFQENEISIDPLMLLKEEILDEFQVDCAGKRNPANNIISQADETINMSNSRTKQPSKLVKRKAGKKPSRCKFCENDISSKNFTRHLLKHHSSIDEVQSIFQMPKNSKARRQALSLLRNDTNFQLFLQGSSRPYRTQTSSENSYYPCPCCKGLFVKKYLKRHRKSCYLQKNSDNRFNVLSESQTVVACAIDPTGVIAKMDVKDQVYSLMKGDDIAFEAKRDLLIAHFGDSYLKKHRNERMAYACSNRMRELSRLLINYRIITNDKVSLQDIFFPKNFDNVIIAAKNISGYDCFNKTFSAPSLAMHLGTSLKVLCDELIHLILKGAVGFQYSSNEQREARMKEIKYFKGLIETRWNAELSSIANKDMQEKRRKKPLLLPLASEVQQFRDGTLKLANECRQNLTIHDNDVNSYKILVQAVLSLLIIFNRREISDVQYLQIKAYQNDKRSTLKDFESVLTETEKILTTKYKKVVNSGKGSRAVVILIPQILQDLTDFLLMHRSKYISDVTNEYVFAVPGSRIKWGKGDVALRNICKKLNTQNAAVITSSKLRKQVATIMQIMNLTKDETKQIANFLGHTEKTHNELYELPVDVYQTAKVSKILLMMEKGSLPVEYRGKSLLEIHIDPTTEYAEVDTGLDSKDSCKKRDENEMEVESNEANTEILNKSILEGIVNDHELLNTNDEGCTRLSVDLDSHEDQSDILSKTVESNSNVTVSSDIERTDTSEIATKTIKKKGKQAWSEKEVGQLRKYFQSNLRARTYPRGEEIKKYIQQHGVKRSVLVVRSKIQHLLKKM